MMMFSSEFKRAIFRISETDFEKTALAVFRFQAEHVPVYRDYLRLLHIDPARIYEMHKIPFLPVEFFKSHRVIAEGVTPGIEFSSSGTSGTVTSKHPVAEKNLYENSFIRGFEHFYGPLDDYCVLALLPSYLEREGSSLVYMADYFVRLSGHPGSGFYLHDYVALAEKLKETDTSGKKVLLLGVTYALLDLAEQFPQPLKNTVIMETGGMKGKRKEIVREELHAVLQNAFGVEKIHSEYGMTELLSQAYSKGDGRFFCPPWMRVAVRDVDDPFAYSPRGRTGGLNIIDLANLYSCSFISVSDLGRINKDGSFEVLGRFDHSEIRGCNLLVQ
ncbi:MAG: putative acyl protein synthase/acyl-CoA reductase-like protein [Bacteroidetes bacterium]|nr:MAG: putative acyl protein synthase/acyl-CoA reductase-like protein [Bacteroidota bacterium]